MYPTRPAPIPPLDEALPPNHPFASYITPPRPHYLRHSSSSTSVASSAPSFYSGPSAYSPCSPSPSRRTVQSPTASLAKPLSPGRISHPLGHTFPRHAGSMPSSPHHSHNTHPHSARSAPPTPTYASLPAELALFDPRPRQTLLQDVEYILGKKLHFPFLARYSSRTRTSSGGSASSSSTRGGEKAGKKSKKEKEKKRGRRLTKEKAYDEDWALWEGMDQLVPDEVVIVRSERGQWGEMGRGQVHRGVREGNWV
ncbi:hypothetical protein IAT38_000043 [Cryptococcus sp. DSM 104549]